MRTCIIGVAVLSIGTAHANMDLVAAIENVRTACGSINQELTDMKTMAGITTAVTSVGAVTGGVATVAGATKSVVDKEIASWENVLQKIGVEQEKAKIVFAVINEDELKEGLKQEKFTQQNLDDKLDALNKASKTLGDVRTGTLAASTATSIAGAVMSGTNRVKGDLKQQIDECLASVKTLSNVRQQARIDGSANDTELARAENIIRACDAWSTVDLSPINKRSTGATVSSGIGAVTGLVGTITSASANSKTVRDATGTEAQNKEKNLNTASNVLAGTTTVAGVSATIFNATQISAIKRAATVADECAGALK